MLIVAATEPGNPDTPNEDWVTAAQRLIVVLDGATARTETGCVQGVAWYAAMLGSAITSLATDASKPLPDVLADAITLTARQHSGCDLRHPGTPSAMVAIVRMAGDWLEHLVLGDTTVIVDDWEKVHVIADSRVDGIAKAERAEANLYPFGSAEKAAALLRMKAAELDARNQPGGFWVAAADPAVVAQALTGRFAMRDVRRLAVLTDGTARAQSVFGLLDWYGVVELLEEHGPAELIRRVRAIEAADPTGTRWPRNKSSDDATAVFAS